MRTRSRAGWLLALLPAAVLADTAGSQFQVGATVVPRTSVAPISAPARVQVTARDLALGPDGGQVQVGDGRGAEAMEDHGAGSTPSPAAVPGR